MRNLSTLRTNSGGLTQTGANWNIQTFVISTMVNNSLIRSVAPTTKNILILYEIHFFDASAYEQKSLKSKAQVYRYVCMYVCMCQVSVYIYICICLIVMYSIYAENFVKNFAGKIHLHSYPIKSQTRSYYSRSLSGHNNSLYLLCS